MKTNVLIIGMYETVGGIETFLLNYLKHIDSEEINLYFLCMYDKFYFSEDILKHGGKIIKITNVKKNPLRYFKELKRIIQKYNIDVVHINMLSAANLVPLIASKMAGVGHIIVHSHNSNVPNNKVKQILHKVNRKMIPHLATDFWACSREAGVWLYGENLPNGKDIVVINNAIEVEKYQFHEQIKEQYKKQNGLSDCLVFGHVGAIREQKNQLRLLDIFHCVAQKCDKAVLVLVGEALRSEELEYKEQMKEKIKLYGLSNKVFFYGNRNDIPALMSMFDAMIFPSKFEGLPLVLVESQAAALPTVISKDVIPDHVKMTDYISFMSLDAPDEQWAEEALKIAGQKRTSTLEEMRNHGYDVNYEAERLLRRYQEAGAR